MPGVERERFGRIRLEVDELRVSLRESSAPTWIMPTVDEG